jgi:hypothetical protein
VSNQGPPNTGATLEANALIERNWFHLHHGWIDLGSRQIADEDQRKARRDVENAMTRLVEEMASQYNTAVVSAAHYQAIWAGFVARALDWSEPRPTIDVQGELLGIFARSYVFGLDGVEGCASELGRLDEIADRSRGIAAALAHDLKWIKAVRDSLQHIEERVQGKAHGKRIPASILVLGNYSDRGFMFTTATGAMVTIEVSEAVLASVRSQISALDRSLTWRRAGPVCPACGGSISPEVIGAESVATANPPEIEWHCRRCGFRQRVGAQA